MKRILAVVAGAERLRKHNLSPCRWRISDEYAVLIKLEQSRCFSGPCAYMCVGVGVDKIGKRCYESAGSCHRKKTLSAQRISASSIVHTKVWKSTLEYNRRRNSAGCINIVGQVCQLFVPV